MLGIFSVAFSLKECSLLFIRGKFGYLDGHKV